MSLRDIDGSVDEEIYRESERERERNRHGDKDRVRESESQRNTYIHTYKHTDRQAEKDTGSEDTERQRYHPDFSQQKLTLYNPQPSKHATGTTTIFTG